MKSLFKFITIFIPYRKLRRAVRKRLIWWWYGMLVKRVVQSVGEDLMVEGVVHVDRVTKLGKDVAIKSLRKEGRGSLVIGNHTRIGHDILVLTENHDYNDPTRLPFADGWTPKDVVIGDYVWIGHQVILLPGTKIGEGAIIQTGSVVHGEIPPLSIVGGNPAKPFSTRNKEIYEMAKAEMKKESMK